MLVLHGIVLIFIESITWFLSSFIFIGEYLQQFQCLWNNRLGCTNLKNKPPFFFLINFFISFFPMKNMIVGFAFFSILCHDLFCITKKHLQFFFFFFQEKAAKLNCIMYSVLFIFQILVGLKRYFGKFKNKKLRKNQVMWLTD